MSESKLFESIEARGLVSDVLGDEAFVRAMLRAEGALAGARADAGLLSPAVAEVIAAACRGPAPDAGGLGAEAAASGTPVLPLRAHLRATLPPDAAAALHRGATSQDIVDTATLLVAAGAVSLILADLSASAQAAAGLAEAHAATAMTGRTLMQEAQPTTFGLKAAAWMGGLDQAVERLAWVRHERLAVQLGGAVGTMTDLGAAAPAVVASFATRLGLREPTAPWHAERSRIADLAAALGLAAAMVAKPALDIVLLGQGEVGEARDALPTRGASSAMPHKRNPVAAVAARACAMQAPGLVANLLSAAGAGEHERAAGAWHAEWRSLRQLLTSVGSAAAWLRDALEHLVVDADRMGANLARAALGAEVGQAEPLVRARLAEHRAAVEKRPRHRVRVHHRVDGEPDAPALVLVNSLGTTLDMWEPQREALARHFRLVRYDLRGHGRSPTPPPPYSVGDLGADLLDLLDELEIRRAHLLGSSIGGMIGLWAASHAPERVERLVVAGASARFGPPEAWRDRARTVLAHGTGAVAGTVVGRWYSAGYAADHPEEVEAAIRMFDAADPAGYAGCALAIAATDLTDVLGRIRAETLVIAGGDDPATPPEHADLIARLVPGARLEVIPEAAHLPNLEYPGRFTRLVLAHLGVYSPQVAR